MSYISVFTSIMTIVSNSLIFFVISVYLFELFFANVGHFWPFHKLAVVRLSIVLFSSFQRYLFSLNYSQNFLMQSSQLDVLLTSMRFGRKTV